MPSKQAPPLCSKGLWYWKALTRLAALSSNEIWQNLKSLRMLMRNFAGPIMETMIQNSFKSKEGL